MKRIITLEHDEVTFRYVLEDGKWYTEMLHKDTDSWSRLETLDTGPQDVLWNVTLAVTQP